MISVVAEDLVFLNHEWDQDVSDASLRGSSVVLRRLVSDGHLGLAWRLLGLANEPNIVAPDLDALLGPIDHADVILAQAGGAVYQGVVVQGVFKYKRALLPEEMKQNYERKKNLVPKSFTLSKFRESASIIVEGETIMRREVILYVSNKLGGSHFDLSRNNSKELERKYMLLDQYRDDFIVAGKNALYFELLSIGQCIVKSSDIQDFLARARHAF